MSTSSSTGQQSRGSDRGTRASDAAQRSSQPFDELYHSGGSGSGSSQPTPTRMDSHTTSSPPSTYNRARLRPPSLDSRVTHNANLPGSWNVGPTGTVRLPRSTSHSQLLSLLSSSMADASSLANDTAPTPFSTAKSQDSSPVRRQITRVPAPAYKSESEPEVWPLTRELMDEFKEFARADASMQPTSPAPTLNVGAMPERGRKAMSFQVLPGHPSPFAFQETSASPMEPMVTPTANSPPATNVLPLTSTLPGRSASERPLPNPPVSNSQARTQPVNPTSSARLSYLLGLPATQSTPAYTVPLPTSNPVSPLTSGSTLQSGTTTRSTSSGSPPFVFDTAQYRPPNPANISVAFRDKKDSAELVDDRDDGEDDIDKEGNGWQVVTQPAEDFNSPLTSSVLIQTETSDLDTSVANTPRSRPGALPAEGQSSIHQLLMALQFGSQQAIPAPVPTYPPAEYAPAYPALAPYPEYPSREPSVAGPPLPAPPGNGSYARPMAPIPPTPHFRGLPVALIPRRPPSGVDSIASSPYPGPLNPFLPLQYPPSVASSPSHIPLPLNEPRPPVRVAQPRRNVRRRPPSESGDSTAPQETESEGEDEEEDVWLDEPSDAEMNGDFHPDFITNDRKRRQKFEQKWRNLVRQFRELDNMTDSTMFLIANNPDQRHTHLVLSRSVMKTEEHMLHAQSAQQSFAAVADVRRRQRAVHMAQKHSSGAMTEEQRSNAAFEHLTNLDVNAIDGEDNLKQALDYAITSLKQLHGIYEEREQRRREEAERQRQEQMSIQGFLQYLGLAGVTPSAVQ
ncbi:hypothetical protein CALVIDRAFT_600540 [Calocera viscosa TUFC12733]|uniref:Uncharacterized protein n=1 Tax=Calocera viscosa (strain TUFC12733) TaxID=1330018 RepID=A0A167JRL2_CALVF|nr:hypothetical protein CALVIDRAFT_600540 [Calocera viscosa TUFC12733]